MAIDRTGCAGNPPFYLLAMDVGKIMNIQNCPDCGGTHFGSSRCPIKYPPAPDPSATDRQLARIDIQRAELKREYEQKLEALDKRERRLLGLKM
jgi:hypothetical protein